MIGDEIVIPLLGCVDNYVGQTTGRPGTYTGIGSGGGPAPVLSGGMHNTSAPERKNIFVYVLAG
jgi:hypothetical protein